MIRYLTPSEDIPQTKSWLGCRIEAALACYWQREDCLAVSLYENEQHTLLCRVGDTLLLDSAEVGGVGLDTSELLEFCDYLGIQRLELCAQPTLMLPAWQGSCHPLLCCDPKAMSFPFAKPPVASSLELRRVFSLLCEGDARFAQETDRLAWLSDLTLRSNRGRAETYLWQQVATASLSAIGREVAWLSSVAVAADARQRGTGRALLEAVLAVAATKGLSLVTAADQERLLPFYQSVGFVRAELSLLVFRREPRF